MALACALAVAASPAGGNPPAPRGDRVDARGVDAPTPAQRPNIIVFLTDDMATYHLKHMPNTRRLIFQEGARFINHYANVSLCCPSRVTMLTGKYAHNTGVRGNAFPDGFHGFHVGDESTSTIGIALRRQAHYSTGLLGKYLNEYPFVESAPGNAVSRTYVPPGWAEWAVPITGQYYGTDYQLNVNGRLKRKTGPRNYLGDLLQRRLLRQIERNRDRSGLMRILSYYAPHRPEPASPLERTDPTLNARVAKLHFPRTPDFDEADVSDKPPYIRRHPRLTRAQRAEADTEYRRELVSLATVDRYVGEVVRALRRTGQLWNTYLVFTSDNGYHLGNHRLVAGKNTPYLTDVRLPMGIRGPGIAPRTIVPEVTGNIDLAPTIADMAGIELPYVADGESLLPLALGREPEAWRGYFFIQRGYVGDAGARTAEPASPAERDEMLLVQGWRGVVAERWEYVVYRGGFEELYDRQTDPHQLDNVLAEPVEERTEEQQRAYDDLRNALGRLDGCVGVEQCSVG